MDKSELHKDHRSRMRARYARDGYDGFTQHEKLEVFLYSLIPRKNTNEISHELLNKFYTLENIFNADVNELMSVNGIGEATALRLINIGKILKHLKTQSRPHISFKNQQELFAYCLETFTNRPENFIVLALAKSLEIFSNFGFAANFPESKKVGETIISLLTYCGCTNLIIVNKIPDAEFTKQTVPKEVFDLAKGIVDTINESGVCVRDYVILTKNSIVSLF